jgi:DNA-directed RNA polymerase subunit RPC12/RpoP
MADRAAQRRLVDAIDPFAPAGSRWVFDPIGTAIYQLEPTWVTAILCPYCEFVTLVPSLPRLLELTHWCPACAKRVLLRPPSDVLAAAPPSSPLIRDPAPRPPGYRN